jgi:IMP dehydrogenase
MPTLQAVIDIDRQKKEMIRNNSDWTSENVPFVIADGGIKNSGDIVKSLAAGADLVMLGSMLSGTKETPGKIILSSEGKKIKRYNGMASKLAQKNWKGSYSSIEGVSSYVSYKGTVSKVINEIMSNVRSGMSYSGVRSLEELRNEAIAVVQTSSSHAEGNPHIFNRNR